MNCFMGGQARNTYTESVNRAGIVSRLPRHNPGFVRTLTHHHEIIGSHLRVSSYC